MLLTLTTRHAPATDLRTYHLKVTVMETDPPIWRRLSVPGDTTLRRLDRFIQTAMGWTNSHLHTFTAGGVIYAEPNWQAGRGPFAQCPFRRGSTTSP